MLPYEDKILQNILKQFDGLPKIDAYDLLHKIEFILHEQSSPISFKEIQINRKTALHKRNIVSLGNRGYCYLLDSCYYINIYQLKSVIPKILGGKSIYFTSKNGYKMNEFDNKTIRDFFGETHLKQVIEHFLRNNDVRKTNIKTNRLLLMELLDQIDPNKTEIIK